MHDTGHDYLCIGYMHHSFSHITNGYIFNFLWSKNNLLGAVKDMCTWVQERQRQEE